MVEWTAIPGGVLVLLCFFVDVSWSPTAGWKVRFGFSVPWRRRPEKK